MTFKRQVAASLAAVMAFSSIPLPETVGMTRLIASTINQQRTIQANQQLDYVEVNGRPFVLEQQNRPQTRPQWESIQGNEEANEIVEAMLVNYEEMAPTIHPDFPIIMINGVGHWIPSNGRIELVPLFVPFGFDVETDLPGVSPTQDQVEITQDYFEGFQEPLNVIHVDMPTNMGVLYLHEIAPVDLEGLAVRLWANPTNYYSEEWLADYGTDFHETGYQHNLSPEDVFERFSFVPLNGNFGANINMGPGTPAGVTAGDSSITSGGNTNSATYIVHLNGLDILLWCLNPHRAGPGNSPNTGDARAYTAGFDNIPIGTLVPIAAAFMGNNALAPDSNTYGAARAAMLSAVGIPATANSSMSGVSEFLSMNAAGFWFSDWEELLYDHERDITEYIGDGDSLEFSMGGTFSAGRDTYRGNPVQRSTTGLMGNFPAIFSYELEPAGSATVTGLVSGPRTDGSWITISDPVEDGSLTLTIEGNIWSQLGGAKYAPFGFHDVRSGAPAQHFIWNSPTDFNPTPLQPLVGIHHSYRHTIVLTWEATSEVCPAEGGERSDGTIDPRWQAYLNHRDQHEQSVSQPGVTETQAPQWNGNGEDEMDECWTPGAFTVEDNEPPGNGTSHAALPFITGNPLPCPGDRTCTIITRVDFYEEPEMELGQLSAEEEPLRWFSLAFAWGETKMATSGFNNMGPSTAAGSISLTRQDEIFEAMAGIPETEFLYINTGSRDGSMEVEYTWHERVYRFGVQWEESDSCPLVCNEHGSPCRNPAPCSCDCDEYGSCSGCCYVQSSFTNTTSTCTMEEQHDDPEALRINRDHTTVTFRFLTLTEASARSVTGTTVTNPTLYASGGATMTNAGTVPLSYTVSPAGILYPNPSPQPSLPHQNNYGTDAASGLAHFQGGYIDLGNLLHTSGTPSARCYDDASDASVFREMESEAWEQANAILGNLFAINTVLEITLGANTYTFASENEQILTGVFNSESDAGREYDLWAAPDTSYFYPNRHNWDPILAIPASGFLGRSLQTSARNGQNAASFPMISGTSPHVGPGLLAWHDASQAITSRLHNGIYNFEPYATQNTANFTNLLDITGHPHPLRSTTNDAPDHVGPHHAAANPGMHLVGPDRVRLEYIAWQEPHSPYFGQQPSGPSSGTGMVHSYFSVNPVIIHNPVSAIFSWVHDVPITVLQDQRIETVRTLQTGQIVPHSRRSIPDDSAGAVSRLYIDFDFRITMPNDGTFNTYWTWDGGTTRVGGQERPGGQGQLSSPTNFGLNGLHDHSNNQRGPGWVGDVQPWFPGRRHENPWGMLGSNLGPTTGHGTAPAIWDVSKWINAKFIQFPFDVYFYGAYLPSQGMFTVEASQSSGGQRPSPAWGGSQHQGGDASGFFPAGTWIQLFDNGGAEIGYDPTDFYFRVASHVRDASYQEIHFLVEAINSPFRSEPTQQRAQGQWDNNSVWNINGNRDQSQYQGWMGSASGQPEGARHAVRSVHSVDIVGRIGNLLVDDSSDPQWQAVFWEEINGNINTLTAVDRAIAVYFNMFESVQQHLGSMNGRPIHPVRENPAIPGGFANRFSTLRQFHNMDMTLMPGVPYTLPVRRNPISHFDQQTMSLGYEIQFSIQTLGSFGDDGSEMWIMPRYFPIGNFVTGTPGQHFALYASDPFDPHGTLRRFWDSNLSFGNWQFGATNVGAPSNMTRFNSNPAIVNWVPQHHHRLYHTLADTRAKVNAIERNSTSFHTAVQRGSQFTTHLGDPSFIRIPGDLMTNIGGQAIDMIPSQPAVTKGRIGQHIDFWEMQSSPGVFGGLDYQPLAFRNAQRWHARHSLPQTTRLIFEQNQAQGLFEGQTLGQYLGISMTFRTHADNGLWDLSLYTGAVQNPMYQPYPDVNPGLNVEGREPIFPPGATPPTGGGNRDWFWPSAPDQPNFQIPSDYNRPSIPTLVVDYSNPAQSDRTTIGTH